MSPCRLLAAAALALAASVATAGEVLELVVERQAARLLEGTFYEVPGRAPGAPRFTIGVQNVVQTGMPSYRELLTIHVGGEREIRWRDLGEPFELGNFVWLVVVDNDLYAIDRQEVAPPRKLVNGDPPRWREADRGELDRLERHLQRGHSALRRPRMRVGAFEVQIVAERTLEVCRLDRVAPAPCRRHRLPKGNDIVYSAVPLDAGAILFSNEGWFRLEADGSLLPAWLPPNNQHAATQSNQVYTALRSWLGVLLGHYPTGNVLRMNSSMVRVSAEPAFVSRPYTKPALNDHREVQALAHYGGRLLAGLWPWGELYELRANSRWTLMRRFFAEPPVTGELAPYAHRTQRPARKPGIAERVRYRLARWLPAGRLADYFRDPPVGPGVEPDVWGQRITQLVPLGPSLYIATGNKSGEHVPRWLEVLPSPAIAAGYGRVYEMTSPGNLACTLPAGSGRLTLRVSVTDTELEVKVNGRRLCALSDRSLARAREVMRRPGKSGAGLYGKLAGGSVSVALHPAPHGRAGTSGPGRHDARRRYAGRTPDPQRAP